jgi:hypothetical protein
MANKTHESLAAEAAAHLEKYAGAMGRFNGIQPEIRRQADCLLKWARKRGVFLDDFDSFISGLEKYGEVTREHVVYLDHANHRVIKCTKPGRFGLGHGSNEKYGNHCPATPWFYLRRIEFMNQLFPTDIRLHGIALGRSEFESERGLKPYIVTSQLFIERANEKREHPSEEEIERFMVELGFNLLDGSCHNWIRNSDEIVVTDTRVLNFIVSHAGIVPIDVIIGKSTSATKR